MSPDPEPGLVLRPDPALRIRVSATTVNTLGTDPGIRGTGRNTPATTDPEPDMWATGTIHSLSTFKPVQGPSRLCVQQGHDRHELHQWPRLPGLPRRRKGLRK
jgi:hypothetical protein